MTKKKERKDLQSGPLTAGGVLRLIRKRKDISQKDFAKKLGISRANLCDLEKGRKRLSPARAYVFSKIIGTSEKLLLETALENSLRSIKLNFKVTVS